MIAIDGIPCRPMDINRRVTFTHEGKICKGILAYIGCEGAGIVCDDGRKVMKDFGDVHYIPDATTQLELV